MASKFKTTTKDTGYAKALKTFNEISKGPSVVTGVLESSGVSDKDSGLTLVEVATFNEFGTESIPERSFIRSTADENFTKYLAKSDILKRKIILQEITIKNALGVMGQLIQSDIIAKINSGVEPANDPKTIAAKGSSKTLIDSGQMKQSIRYKVEGS